MNYAKEKKKKKEEKKMTSQNAVGRIFEMKEKLTEKDNTFLP